MCKTTKPDKRILSNVFWAVYEMFNIMISFKPYIKVKNNTEVFWAVTIRCATSLPKFQRNLLPPYSGLGHFHPEHARRSSWISWPTTSETNYLTMLHNIPEQRVPQSTTTYKIHTKMHNWIRTVTYTEKTIKSGIILHLLDCDTVVLYANIKISSAESKSLCPDNGHKMFKISTTNWN